MRGLIALSLLIMHVSAFGADIRRIPLRTTALVADPVRGRLYATTPGTAGPSGNQVVTIFPESASLVLPGVFVGSEPVTLAIDDAATVLYVALRGAAQVSRVQLSTFTRDLSFGLGADDFFGPFYAQDLAVMPGAAQTVAVSLAVPGFSPQHQGVAVFDDGVRRAIVTPSHTGSNIIAFGNDPTRLYGLNNETSESGFRRMSVDATGVAVIDVTSLPTSSGSDLEFDGDYVLTTGGSAILPEGPSSPTQVGSYTVDGPFGFERVSGPVESDPARDRVYYVYQSFSRESPSLLTYARSTFALIDELPLPQVEGAVHSLVRWGSEGLAFATNEGEVFLIGTFAPCGNDEQCDDADECTVDTCGSGACTHAPVSCRQVECKGATCDPKRGCVASFDNIGQPCADDGNACTNDLCGFNGCEHTTAYGRPCEDDGDPCTNDVCGFNGCEHSTAFGLPCADDANPCTTDLCGQDGCGHEITEGFSCTDDGDACTQDLCDATGACRHDALRSDVFAYYFCAFENVSSLVRDEPLCVGQCAQNLRRRYDDLENAVFAAFESISIGAVGTEHCRSAMRRAVEKASVLAQLARRMNRRSRLQPPAQGAALVSACKETVKRLRRARTRFCPPLPSAE